jgi:hypothetical protein
VSLELRSWGTTHPVRLCTHGTMGHSANMGGKCGSTSTGHKWYKEP